MSTANQLDTKRNIQVDQQILTFQLRGEMFGLEILKVKELLEFNGITKIPMVPEYIRGVINLRGNVVPVVDLIYLFSKTPSDVTKKSCIIIVESISGDTSSATGILVDNVNEVIDVAGSDIEPPPSFGTNLKTNFILGMAKVGEEIVILLDMDYILSYDEISNMSEFNFKSLYEQAKANKSV